MEQAGVLLMGMAILAGRFAVDVLAVVAGLAIWNWWVARRRQQGP